MTRKPSPLRRLLLLRLLLLLLQLRRQKKRKKMRTTQMKMKTKTKTKKKRSPQRRESRRNKRLINATNRLPLSQIWSLPTSSLELSMFLKSLFFRHVCEGGLRYVQGTFST